MKTFNVNIDFNQPQDQDQDPRLNRLIVYLLKS